MRSADEKRHEDFPMHSCASRMGFASAPTAHGHRSCEMLQPTGFRADRTVQLHRKRRHRLLARATPHTNDLAAPSDRSHKNVPDSDSLAWSLCMHRWFVHDWYSMWNFIELDVGIVAASLPTLKPLFGRLLNQARRWTSGQTGSEHHGPAPPPHDRHNAMHGSAQRSKLWRDSVRNSLHMFVCLVYAKDGTPCSLGKASRQRGQHSSATSHGPQVDQYCGHARV